MSSLGAVAREQSRSRAESAERGGAPSPRPRRQKSPHPDPRQGPGVLCELALCLPDLAAPRRAGGEVLGGVWRRWAVSPWDLCSQGLGAVAGAVLTLVLPLRALAREQVLFDLLPFLLNPGPPLADALAGSSETSPSRSHSEDPSGDPRRLQAFLTPRRAPCREPLNSFRPDYFL